MSSDSYISSDASMMEENAYGDTSVYTDASTSTLDWSSTEEGISIYFVVFFTLLALVLVLSKFLHDNPRLSAFFPEAGMIILVGVVAGFVVNLFNPSNDNADDEPQDVADSLLSFSPGIFFTVLLPPIIFNSGYHLKRELFFRHITPILLFSCVGTFVSAMSVAWLLRGITDWGWIHNDFYPTTTELLTFGALISSTDPVSTLAVFQAKRVDPHLFYLVFGESVLNDAVGLVLFRSFSKFVRQENGAATIALGCLEFLVDFTLDSLGSLCLGILSGLLAALLLKRIDMRETQLLELSLYILIMYVPFFLAEIMQLSGIVTILFTGIAARRYVVPNLSDSTEENADVIFRLAAHLAETSIFLELGLSVFGLSGHLNWSFVLWALLACLIARALNVFPIAYFFNRTLKDTSTTSLPVPPPAAPKEGFEMSEVLDAASHKELDEKTIAQQIAALPESSTQGHGPNSRPIDKVESQGDLRIPMNTAWMLWFSGLRGAVAYACVKTFPDTFGHRKEFIMTTMVLVLVTVFCMGGTTEKMLNALNIATNVDEDKYMRENWKTAQRPTGFVSYFENKYVQRYVIRDFHVLGELPEGAMDPIPSPGRSYHLSDHRIEMTELEHMENVQQMNMASRRKKSLFDYGANR